MQTNRTILVGLAALFFLSSCANQDAAQLGSLIWVGAVDDIWELGKPVGTVATAIDETFRTAGDIVKENPRFQNQRNNPKPAESPSLPNTKEDHYYKAEVLVKTRGPAQIESLSLQQTEDVSEFWK